jgi:hypothetical protein
MNDADQPLVSLDGLSWLGWPFDRRRSYLDDAAKTAEHTYPVEFQARLQHLTILTVPIELPKYRLWNGRTSSLQQEYLAKHPNKPKDFFTSDPERHDVQFVQHQLLTEMVRGAGLKRKFEDESVSQNQPIILDEFGIVINGNRRLCQWRNLYNADKTKWSRYSHIQVVVLPHADDKEIDRLEASLQVDEDIRDDYVWHSLANMMRDRQAAHGLTNEELARLYKMKPGDVKELFDMLDYAAEYLRSRGHENEWSRVNETEEAFRKIVERRRSIQSAGAKELFKESAFVLIDRPDDVGGRLYAAIPDVQRFLDPIKTELEKVIQLPPSPDYVDDLLGGTSPAADEMRLAAAIKKDEAAKKLAREIIKDVIDNQRGLEKDLESAGFLLKLLSKANTLLETAVTSGLRPGATRQGAEQQLMQLESKIARVRKWLSEQQ